MYKVPKI